MGTLWVFQAIRLANDTLSIFLGSAVSTAFNSLLADIYFALKCLELETFVAHPENLRRENLISVLSCWILGSFCFAWHYPEKVLRFLDIIELLIRLPPCSTAVTAGVKELTVLRGLLLLG